MIFYILRNHAAEESFIPDFRDTHLHNHRVSEFAGHYAIDLMATSMNGIARVIKRIEDIVVGICVTLLILPLPLAIALAIKFTSLGPVVFEQYRTGAIGKQFKVYKFRLICAVSKAWHYGVGPSK